MSFPKTAMYQLRVRIKGFERKWTEKIFLGTSSSFVAPMVLGKQYVQFRRLIMSAGYSIFSAKVHRMDTKRDRKTVITSALVGLMTDAEVAATPAALEKCNNVNTCLNVSFETDDGQANVRQFRGLRDSWVTDDTLQFVPAGIAGALAVPVPGTDDQAGLTKEVALGNFLTAVAYYDSLIVKDPTIPNQFNSVPWTTIAVGAVSSRDTGNSGGPRGRKAAA